MSVDGPAVIFFGKGTGRDKRPWGVNIGNVFLKDFVVTVDYTSKLVTLENLSSQILSRDWELPQTPSPYPGLDRTFFLLVMGPPTPHALESN
jgi:hypothetical protein